MKATQVSTPKLNDPYMLDDNIKRLKFEIEYECYLLFQRAKTIYSASQEGKFRLTYWENRLDEIKKSKKDSYNLGKLRELKKECNMLGKEMEEFARELP